MRRRLLLLIVLGAGVLAFVAQTQAMSAPKLTGTVGPGFTISLRDATGKKVTKLKAGKYTFVVTDKSSIHNFVLEKPLPKKKGKPAFEKDITNVGQTIKNKVFTVTLTKGKWEVYCAPHEDMMKQKFTVT
jgi:copper binding plastocyanin/azurin family protein